MYGAIIGDVAGSYYECLELNDKINDKKRSMMERRLILDKAVPLFSENSSCTDDSILLCAVADAALNNKDYEDTLREYGSREIKQGKDMYGRDRFSKGFISWINEGNMRCSYGNGCAMRVSPIAFIYDDLDTIITESFKATVPTHNHLASFKAVEALNTSIYALNCKISKEELKKYIMTTYYPLRYNLEDLQEYNEFSSKASDSVPKALFCFFESNSFEDAIRKAISIGGDTDTIACITGALAESYYGVPNELIEQVKPYLKDYMIPVIDKFYHKEKSKVYEKCNKNSLFKKNYL